MLQLRSFTSSAVLNCCCPALTAALCQGWLLPPSGTPLNMPQPMCLRPCKGIGRESKPLSEYVKLNTDTSTGIHADIGRHNIFPEHGQKHVTGSLRQVHFTHSAASGNHS